MEQQSNKPVQVRKKASYINPFVEDTIILEYAKGDSISQISKRHKVHWTTCSRILKSEVAQNKLNILKSNLADKLEEIARKFVYSIKDEEIPNVSPAQRMTCIGIAIDKIQLLRNKPTEIIKSDIPSDVTNIINYIVERNKTQDIVEVKESTQDIVKLS